MNWSNVKLFQLWLLFIPVVGFFYLGLFMTMRLWYPVGLPPDEWQAHILNFSVIYLLWIVIFYSNRLFELGSFRSLSTVLSRLTSAFILCAVAAVVYFYFQPTLILTPRRFLLVHLFISSAAIGIWYIFAQRIFPYTSRNFVFAHHSLEEKLALEQLLEIHPFAGLKYQGVIDDSKLTQDYSNALVVFPRNRINLETEAAEHLFELRRLGVRFVEYHELYERVSRQVPLQALTELWFIDFVDYGAHRIFDILKRIIDLILGLIGFIIFLVTFPFIALLIKLSSQGPVFFKQLRVGRGNKPFILYKYRSMVGGATNTWTQLADNRITGIGKLLRWIRLDELPQSINILKGNMSVVGPRPEQVNIVQELQSLIPYYNERHLVKPGLTGWAQLHVYAGSLEETKKKLQYDLYYIKHRSLLFDLEIILKTVYNIITFAGR